jgi:ribulose-bisphosphate carboxylase small chain
MWAPPQFDLTEDEVATAMDEVRAACGACRGHYVKVVCYDRALGRQSSRLSFIVGRPAHEPGFRLERQEQSDRRIRYTLHSYATDAPAGDRYSQNGTGS